MFSKDVSLVKSLDKVNAPWSSQIVIVCLFKLGWNMREPMIHLPTKAHIEHNVSLMGERNELREIERWARKSPCGAFYHQTPTGNYIVPCSWRWLLFFQKVRHVHKAFGFSTQSTSNAFEVRENKLWSLILKFLIESWLCITSQIRISGGCVYIESEMINGLFVANKISRAHNWCNYCAC